MKMADAFMAVLNQNSSKDGLAAEYDATLAQVRTEDVMKIIAGLVTSAMANGGLTGEHLAILFAAGVDTGRMLERTDRFALVAVGRA